MGQIMEIDYTNFDPRGGSTKERRDQPRPPKKQRQAVVPGVDPEYHGVRVPDRPHNFGLALPESDNVRDWAGKHMGWVVLACLAVIFGVMIFFAAISLDSIWEWIAVPTFASWLVLAWFLFYGTKRVVKKTVPRTFSMFHVAAIISLWGLATLVVFFFKNI